MQYLLYATFLAIAISAQYTTNLTSHAIIAATAITLVGGNTSIFGDVSILPGTSTTGLIQNQNVIGTIHVNDQQAIQAKQTLNTAFNTLSDLTATRNLIVADLSSLTLTAGVYNFSTRAISLVGNLTLAGSGLFVFQISTTFIATRNSNIVLINGAVASQIYFVVGTSVIIGTGSAIQGMLLARQSITVDGARIYGGLYAQNAAVTITQPSTVIATPPTSSSNNGTSIIVSFSITTEVFTTVQNSTMWTTASTSASTTTLFTAAVMTYATTTTPFVPGVCNSTHTFVAGTGCTPNSVALVRLPLPFRIAHFFPNVGKCYECFTQFNRRFSDDWKCTRFICSSG